MCLIELTLGVSHAQEVSVEDHTREKSMSPSPIGKSASDQASLLTNTRVAVFSSQQVPFKLLFHVFRLGGLCWRLLA